VSTRKYVLTSGLEEGNLVFLGVGGDINGLVNPTLYASPGETVTVVFVNSGEGEHDVSFPDLRVKTKRVKENGESVSVTFTVPNEIVNLEYYDSVANHAEIGMVGELEISGHMLSETSTENLGDQVAAKAFLKGGCAACHTIPGVPDAVGNLGPDLTNIGDVAAERVQGANYSGYATTAEEYIQESITTPGAFVVSDCPTGPCQGGLMPPFETVFNNKEIEAVVNYLAGLPEGVANLTVQTTSTGDSQGADPMLSDEDFAWAKQ
jgi:plastocyanin/mono/diheme cytochrome c family protein